MRRRNGLTRIIYGGRDLEPLTGRSTENSIDTLLDVPPIEAHCLDLRTVRRQIFSDTWAVLSVRQNDEAPGTFRFRGLKW
jgi:hypothetical protein